MIPLTALYKEILESLGLVITQEGFVSLRVGEKTTPCVVSNKRLALPIPEVLKTSDWDNVVAFHPLSEKFTFGESPVLKKLRSLVNYRITEVIVLLMDNLMQIAANTDYHKKLSPPQKAFLEFVKDADEKTVAALHKVIGEISSSGPNRIVNVYLKRGGKMKGKSFGRLAIVSFEINDEFEPKTVTVDGEQKPDYSIFGVKMRKKDKESIVGLFNWLIPDANDLERYSFGTDDKNAPYFSALLGAYANIATHLNDRVHLFKKHLEDAESMHINLSWLPKVENLTQYRDQLPTPLAGNEGTPIKGSGGEEMATEVPKSPVKAPSMLQNSLLADNQLNKVEPPPPWEEEKKPAAVVITKKDDPLAIPIIGAAAKPANVNPNGTTVGAPAAVRDDGSDWQMTVMRNNVAFNQPPPFAAFAAGGGMAPAPVVPSWNQQPPYQQGFMTAAPTGPALFASFTAGGGTPAPQQQQPQPAQFPITSV